MNFKPIIALYPLLLLAACSGVPVNSAPAIEAAAQPVEKKAEKPAEKPVKKVEEVKLPQMELSDQLLFEFMLAEIAGQRGNLGVAEEAYADLAKKTRDPRIVSRALDIALYSGRQGEALELSRLLLELDPSSLKAEQTLSALLIRFDKLDEARPQLEKLLAEEGENIGQGLLQLALLLNRVPDKAAALTAIQEMTAPYADHAEAHYAIAQLAMEAGRKDLALAEIKKAMELHPGWEMGALLEGRILLGASAQAALDFYANFLQTYADSGEVRLTYAKLLVAEKRFADARGEFEHLRRDFPGNADMQLAVALLSMQLGDIDPAIAVLKQLLEENYKEQDTVRFYLGQAYEQQKNWNEAKIWYQSVQKGEQYFTAQIRYAEILAKNGELNKAVAYLRQIRSQNEGQQILLIQAQAQLLREQRLYQDAWDVLDQGLRKFPDSPELLYDHAMAAEKLNNLDVLEKDLRRLIKLQPENAQAYNALGYTLAEHTDRLQEALPLIEKALSLTPEDPYIIDSMGWVQHRLGNEEQAIVLLQRAMGSHPDPEIAAHLGEVLWVSGKKEEARQVWQSSLQENPGNEALLNSMKKFGQ